MAIRAIAIKAFGMFISSRNEGGKWMQSFLHEDVRVCVDGWGLIVSVFG
jgi:hypothetical protein